jgi:hypothetical protein
MNYFEVNLPTPSEKLLQMIQELKAIQPETNPDCYRPAVDAAGPSVNAAECMYFCNDQIYDQVMQEYSTYFTEKFAVCVLVLRNHTESANAFYPPHQDMFRQTSLNFVIDAGGDSVETLSYDRVGSYEDLTGQLVSYDTVNVHKRYRLNSPAWYALDVVRYHSVENISSDRIILALSFTDINLTDLSVKYPHLVKQVL